MPSTGLMSPRRPYPAGLSVQVMADAVRVTLVSPQNGWLSVPAFKIAALQFAVIAIISELFFAIAGNRAMLRAFTLPVLGLAGVAALVSYAGQQRSHRRRRVAAATVTLTRDELSFDEIVLNPLASAGRAVMDPLHMDYPLATVAGVGCGEANTSDAFEPCLRVRLENRLTNDHLKGRDVAQLQAIARWLSDALSRQMAALPAGRQPATDAPYRVEFPSGIRICPINSLDVPTSAKTFRVSARWSIVLAIAGLLGAIGVVAAATYVDRLRNVPLLATGFVTCWFLLFALMGGLDTWYKRRHPQWRCRADSNRLWLRFSRDEDSPAIELPRSAISWVRPVKLTDVWKSETTTPSRRSSSTTYRWYRYVEFGLTESAAVDLARAAADASDHSALADALADRPIIPDAPARITRPGVIRVNWNQVAPSFAATMSWFTGWTDVRPLVKEQMRND